MIIIRLFLLTILMSLIVNCSDHEEVDRADWPEKLTFGVIPLEKPDEIQQRYAAFAQYLERKLKIPVEIYVPNDYTSVIKEMKEKRIDVAEYGAKSYITATQEANAKVFAKKVYLHGEDGYYGLIITNKSSGITQLSQLKEKKWAYVDGESTSGMLVPNAYFYAEAKIDPETYFSEIHYSGNHETSILMVRNGEVDAAATNNNSLQFGVVKGLWRLEDFNIIWQSLWIPADPIAYRNDLPISLKQALQDAFIHCDDQKALQAIHMTKFVSANPIEYEFMRKLVEFNERRNIQQ